MLTTYIILLNSLSKFYIFFYDQKNSACFDIYS